jgi:hypothetical protein
MEAAGHLHVPAAVPREGTSSAYSTGGWVVGIRAGPETRENLLSVPGIEGRFYSRLVRSLVTIQS